MCGWLTILGLTPQKLEPSACEIDRHAALTELLSGPKQRFLTSADESIGIDWRFEPVDSGHRAADDCI